MSFSYMTLRGYTKIQEGEYHLVEYKSDSHVPDYMNIYETRVFTDRELFIKFLTRDLAPADIKEHATYCINYIPQENPTLSEDITSKDGKPFSYQELLEIAKTVTRVGIIPNIYYTTQHISPDIYFIPKELLSKTYKTGKTPILIDFLYRKEDLA